MEMAVSSLTTIQVMIGVGVLCALNFIGVLYTLYSLKKSSIESTRINRETFGLLKKVEGLVARKQERLTREYDQLLEKMATQVPIIVAREAGKEVFEAEKYVLTRLAELEPALSEDAISLQKMETIIKTMEGLENVVIQSTARAVESILVEKRKSLFDQEVEEESSAA